jgi:type IX secretion system PorP/SprF family membrane protein
MNYLNLKIFFLLVFFTKFCSAQQEPLFTLYWNNYSIYNPAATGVFNSFYSASNSRIQWTKIQDPIVTQATLVDYKISKINSGVGLNYVFDKIGFEKSNKINLNYAYHYKFKNERVLSSGISLGYEKQVLDLSAFLPITYNDPAIPKSSVNNYLNVSAGLLFKTPRLLIGISATQLNEDNSAFYKKARHLFIQLAYIFNASNNIEIKPGIYYRHTINSAFVETNIRVAYKKIFWGGLGYRHNNAIFFMAGIDIKEKYRIAYAYDYLTNKFSNFGPTHELGLAIMLH